MDKAHQLEKRKEKLATWLKNKYNLALIGLLIVSFLIRIYYIMQTKGQTLWWDEAEYMSTAKHWAFNVPYLVNPQRPPLFQFLASIFLSAGFGEIFLRILLVVIPSILVIYATYLLGKELFSEKVALFSAIAVSFMWSYIFWANRFQPDFFSLAFQLISLFFFWKMFSSPKLKFAAYAGFFAALAFYFKISALLVPVSVFIFAIVLDGFKVIKNKTYWTSFFVYLITLLPFMLWQFSSFGDPIAFSHSYAGEGISGRTPGWMTLNFFFIFSKELFFILFLIGIGVAIFEFVVTSDLLLKERKKRMDPRLYSIIILLVVSLFHIFYIQGVIEDRWVFLLAPFIFYFSALASFSIANFLKKYNSELPKIFLIIIFAIFVYSQMSHTDALIKNKAPSYEPVKEASLWAKENSNPSDILLSISYTQAVAYSQMNVYSYSEWNSSYMDQFISENHPKYLMVSLFEPHPSWVNLWISNHTSEILPAQVYFADEQNQQPVLILYEIKS